jgi:hypothetical protein
VRKRERERESDRAKDRKKEIERWKKEIAKGY